MEGINQAGEKIEDSGNKMRRSTYLSLGGTGLYILGALFSVESPGLGTTMMLGGFGVSIWSWVEGFRSQSDLRDGGAELKNSVKPTSQW